MSHKETLVAFIGSQGVGNGEGGISDKQAEPIATSNQTSHAAMGHLKPHRPPTSPTAVPG